MVQIDVLLWKSTPEDIIQAKKVVSSIKDLVEPNLELEINVYDTSVTEYNTSSNICISFSQMASCATNAENPWLLPKITSLYNKPENKDHRREALDVLKQVAKYISTNNSTTETKTYIKTANSNVTIGNIADICVTEREATYLKNLRDLLAGGTMVIEKGNIKITVTDNVTVSKKE
jgi:hypothetical protein